MTLLIILGILSLVSAPQLVGILCLLSLPVSCLLAISAWSDYSSPIPLADALYLNPSFWIVEGVGLLTLAWLVLIWVENIRRG